MVSQVEQKRQNVRAQTGHLSISMDKKVTDKQIQMGLSIISSPTLRVSAAPTL